MMSVHPKRIDLRAILRLAELADYIVPFTIRVVADLGIADLLADGPRTAEALAEATGSHAPSLRRALRALACKGIFAEVEPGLFALTPIAGPLRSDHPLSLRGAFPLLAADVQAWAHFDYTIRTGLSAFKYVHSINYYDYLSSHPDMSVRVDRAVESVNALVIRSVARVFDWAGVGVVVDVGSGNGAFLAGLLARNEKMRGVLIDLPHVVAGAAAILREAGVSDRCEIVPGSFFDSVPPGADVYVLKTILHDWDDERTVAILRRVRSAMRPASRVLLIEAILPPGDAFDVGKLMDIHSLMLAAGPDRTVDQFARLFLEAGLALKRVLPTSNALTFIEAGPAEARSGAAPGDSRLATLDGDGRGR